jgi:PrgI family protein
MKTTIVPAQVTTVEDKIAGNLNFTQLLLLTAPVFLSGALFAFLPPFMSFRSYKLVICVMVALVCMTLAIRIKGKILLLWVSIIGRYNLRPRYYIFNKNDSHLRTEPNKKQKAVPEKATKAKSIDNQEVKRDVPLTEMVRLEDAVADPRAKFHFKTTKKGGLRVFISEVK